MIVFPNTKINLGLSVTAKRPDGFHNIESVFYPLQWHECLELTHRDEDAAIHQAVISHATSGKVNLLNYGDPIPGKATDNLCLKVYHLLEEWYNLPEVDLHLLKTTPIGAGLGGGSADAAYMLKALTTFFNLNISDAEAIELLTKVGSDCPFFYKNQPVFVFGRGEKMRPIALDLSGYHILLINPGIHISTKEAYAAITPKDPVVDLSLLADINIENWHEAVVNDFEGGLFVKYPELAVIKTALYERGALYASMTGTGSTIYGIFKEEPELDPDWKDLTTWSGKLTL